VRGKSTLSGFVFGFASTSVVSWNYCRFHWRESKEATKNILLAQSQGADPRLRKGVQDMQQRQPTMAPEGTLNLDEPIMPKKK
jgi:hypothetical protein